MNDVNLHVGKRIQAFRKERKLTLQQLADLIHKSRASVSKYENGEVTLDVVTLHEIAKVLQVTIGQLTDFMPEPPQRREERPEELRKSPFFEAKALFFYFYDGRYNRLKNGLIHINEKENEPGAFEASLSIISVTPSGRSSEVYYTGRVVYSDMLIRFSFVNQCNALEEDLLYIFNPLEIRDSTVGLLCGISSADLKPCAFKCLVTLTPQAHTEALRRRLLFTKEELARWQKLNMLLVENH